MLAVDQMVMIEFEIIYKGKKIQSKTYFLWMFLIGFQINQKQKYLVF